MWLSPVTSSSPGRFFPLWGLGLPRGHYSARSEQDLRGHMIKSQGAGGGQGRQDQACAGGLWEQRAGHAAVGPQPACLPDAFPGHPQEPPSEPAPLCPNSCFGWEHLRNSSWESFIGASYWAPGKPVHGFAGTTGDFPGRAPHREFSQLRKQLASPEANSCIVTSHSFMVLWDRGPQFPVGRGGCVAATRYKDSWSHPSDPAPQGFGRPEDLCFNRCWFSHLRNCPKCFPRQISKGLWAG